MHDVYQVMDGLDKSLFEVKVKDIVRKVRSEEMGVEISDVKPSHHTTIKKIKCPPSGPIIPTCQACLVKGRSEWRRKPMRRNIGK